MASPSTEPAAHPAPTIRDVIGRDDYDDFIAEEEEEEEEDEEDEWELSKRMSRLSMEGSDGGDADDENDEVRSDVNGATYARPWAPYDDDDGPAAPEDLLLPPPPVVPSSASLPGTPDRRGAQASSPWRWAGPSNKEYASETEAAPPGGGAGSIRSRRRHRQHQHQHYRRQRVMREVWLERAWRVRKQRRQLVGEEGEEQQMPVVVLGGGGEGGVAMDMEEVRACRDLGLDLPYDWTVEIPGCYYALSGVDTASSGGNSPASAGSSWRISSPGDDPKDVKARLKVWAQAVALASASRLGS